MTDTTFPYKLGLLPGTIPVGLKMLTYYMAGDLPQAPPSVSVPTFSSGWGMLGNDRYGCCGVAGIQHGFEVDAAVADTPDLPGPWPTDQQTIEYYLTYTKGQDTGVNLSQFLQYVRTTGYYGSSVEAYAPVAVNDVPTLQTSVFLYGFAYTGIAVHSSMLRVFQQAEAAGITPEWTTDVLLSPLAGGHCVPVVGYDDQWLYVITWGQICKVSYSLWHQIATEAWAVLTGQFVSKRDNGRGIDLAALQADLNRLDA
jgi:hypothetical protein